MKRNIIHAKDIVRLAEILGEKQEKSNNPIKTKKLPAKISCGTRVQQAVITTSKNLSNVRVYIEEGLVYPDVITQLRKQGGKYGEYTKRQPLLLGDIKKGDKVSIWSRIQVKDYSPAMPARTVNMDVSVTGNYV